MTPAPTPPHPWLPAWSAPRGLFPTSAPARVRTAAPRPAPGTAPVSHTEKRPGAGHHTKCSTNDPVPTDGHHHRTQGVKEAAPALSAGEPCSNHPEQRGPAGGPCRDSGELAQDPPVCEQVPQVRPGLPAWPGALLPPTPPAKRTGVSQTPRVRVDGHSTYPNSRRRTGAGTAAEDRGAAGRQTTRHWERTGGRAVAPAPRHQASTRI